MNKQQQPDSSTHDTSVHYPHVYQVCEKSCDEKF